MSKITEYLSLIPKGLPHSGKIIESVINNVRMKWGHLPKEQVDEIMKRRFICTQCPFISGNATSSKEFFALKGRHYVTKREDEHCSLCGCGIEGKTASLAANCGIESWNSEHPEKQLEVKWTKFEKDGK